MLLSTPFATPTAKTASHVAAQVDPQVTQAPLVVKRASSISGWTSLGPITTLWTPAASCYLTTTSYGGSLYIYDHFTGSIISSITCNPPIPWLPLVTSSELEFYGPATWTSRYYSPAICPSGWSTAADLSPSWQTVTGGNANTAFLCCPTGFTAPLNTLDPCTSYLPSGATLSNVWSRPTVSRQVSIGSSTVLAPQVLQTSQRVDAMPIVVLWQSTDSQILDIIASMSSTASRAQITSTNGSNSSQNLVLSAGAKGGIAAGIVVVFLAIVLGIFCAFRTRGRKVNSDNEDELQTTSAQKTNTHAMTNRRDTREMIKKYEEALEIAPNPKRNTYDSTATHDSNGNWNHIPIFPVPPSSTPPPQELSSRYNIPKIETNYRVDSQHGYAAVPLRSPGVSRFEEHEMARRGSGTQEVMSPGEQLTPTTYVPPGSAGFSRQSTALGSSSPRSFGRSSGTTLERGLYPLPLYFDSGGTPSDPQSRRTSPIPVSERENGSGVRRNARNPSS